MAAVLSFGGSIPLPTFGVMVPITTGSVGSFRSAFGTHTLDLTAEKCAHIGAVTWKDRGSHTISSAGGKIHFHLSTTTFANAGTSLDIGLQDLTAALPDTTFDVKATLVPGVETLTGSAVNTATMETGTKTVATGDILAVVWDMTARAGADSVLVTGMSLGAASGVSFPYGAFHNATSWAVSSTGPNVLLEADDGMFGWMDPYPFRPSSLATVTFNSTTGTFDEYGARIKLPWPVTVDAVSLPLQHSGAGADFEVCVYTDILGTPTIMDAAVVVDGDLRGSGGDRFSTVRFVTPKVFAKDTVYGITVRPTSANNLSIDNYPYGTGNNAKMAGLPMGPECYQIKRLDNTGVFTEENTTHFPMILHVSKFDDGVNAGGSPAGLRIHHVYNNSSF